MTAASARDAAIVWGQGSSGFLHSSHKNSSSKEGARWHCADGEATASVGITWAPGNTVASILIGILHFVLFFLIFPYNYFLKRTCTDCTRFLLIKRRNWQEDRRPSTWERGEKNTTRKRKRVVQALKTQENVKSAAKCLAPANPAPRTSFILDLN